MSRSLLRLSLLQGWFYVITGLWPIVHLRSFEAISGEKTDDWLVLTVGGLIAVTGIALLMGALRRSISPELAVVAAGQALALAIADILSVQLAGISSIYLVDAAVELALVILWILMWRAAGPKKKPTATSTVVDRLS